MHTTTSTQQAAPAGERLPLGARLVERIGYDKAAPLMAAKVYRLPHGAGYLVRFFKNGQAHKTRADYETEDLGDAIGTTKHSVRRAYLHYGSASTVPLSARA